MSDRDFINFLIKSCFSNAKDPHLATLYNTFVNRLNDIADKLEKQEQVLKSIKEKEFDYDRFNYAIKYWQTTKEQVEVYNNGIANSFKYTEEEFSALKEVLG